MAFEMMVGRYNNDLLHLCLLSLLIGATALSQHQQPSKVLPPSPPINNINSSFSSRRDALHQTIASLCAGSTITRIHTQPAYAMYENGPTTQSKPISIGSTGLTYQDFSMPRGHMIVLLRCVCHPQITCNNFQTNTLRKHFTWQKDLIFIDFTGNRRSILIVW